MQTETKSRAQRNSQGITPPRLLRTQEAALDSSSIQPEWLDLRSLGVYASASDKTLRNWIHAASDPLPASQRGNKIYVRRRDFDAWMQRQSVQNKTVAINRIVEEIVRGVTD